MSEAPARKAWFAPKRYGYGAGLPIAWEGWAVLVIFLAGVSALAYWGKQHQLPLAAMAVILVWTGILIWIARARTEGGWRWRSGDE